MYEFRIALIGSRMKPTSPSISNLSQDSHTLLGTLPANSITDIQPPTENSASTIDSGTSQDEVRQTNLSQVLTPVPKVQGNLSGHLPRLVTVKALSKLYGLNQGAIYAFIKAEPDFPYVNVGIKKKFLVDMAQFETWLNERTKKQKHEHFTIPTSLDLTTIFKNTRGNK